MTVLFISCVNEKIEVASGDKSHDEAVGANDVPGKAFVYFSDDMIDLIESDLASGSVRTKSSEFNDVLDALGITEMHRVFPHAGKFEQRTRKAGLHKWYVVTYSEEIPHTKAADTFLGMKGIECIEPVSEIRPLKFNDPDYGKLWGLNNTDTPEADINVESVWEQYTTGSSDVIVCVVDTGVDINHEDLRDNCMTAADVKEYAKDNTTHQSYVPGYAGIVAGDHGTHVAGTIAAVNNNGIGISGIAGGDKAQGISGVKILSHQIFVGEKGTTDEMSANAIKDGADKGAVISQNSWGYPKEITKAKEVHKAAIDYFIEMAGYDEHGNQVGPMAGGIVFFAAGNDGIEDGAPAEYENVIAVGAIDRNGDRSSFSNYGSWVDIAAPGTDIYSTVPGGYESMNGTSMACPHVSGVAALLVSKLGGPGFTNDMLKERLLGSADTETVPAGYMIGGLLNAYGAMVYGKVVDLDPVEDIVARVNSNKFRLDWTVTKDSEGDAPYGFMIVYGTDKAALEAAAPDNLKDVRYVNYTPGTAVGKPEKYVMRNLEFEKTYYIKVYAYSFGRQYSPASEILEITTDANKAPEVTIADEKAVYELEAYQKTEISLTITEPDRHEIRGVEYKPGYEYEEGDVVKSADTFRTMPDGSYRVVIVGADAPEGEYTAKLTVTDEYGLSFTKELKYKVLKNEAPVKVKEIENMKLDATGMQFTIDMGDYVTDADGEPLEYGITVSDPLVLHVITKGNSLVGTALDYGASTVSVKARDARGETVEFPFKVQVREPSQEVSVYPLNVTDYVSVGTFDEAAETRICVYSQTGRTVYDKTSMVSGYEPAKIDMTECSPGVYSVTVAFNGKEYKQNIVKL